MTWRWKRVRWGLDCREVNIMCLLEGGHALGGSGGIAGACEPR